MQYPETQPDLPAPQDATNADRLLEQLDNWKYPTAQLGLGAATLKSVEKVRRAKIVGTGFYAPDRVVLNQYFNELYKKDIDSFLKAQRNIYERRFMDESQSTSDLILPAAIEALRNAKIAAEELDLIIVATDTPDFVSPATAAVVQHKLGAINAGFFDINSACAGFVTAVDMASKYIGADPYYKKILVVGAYGMSKYLNWEDFRIASLFADGAGAVVITQSDDDTGVLTSQLYGDGQYYDYMGIYAGGTAQPITHKTLDNKENLLNFAKKIPIETNSTHWPRLTRSLLKRVGKSPDQVNHFFMTQININSINETMDSLGVPRSRSHNIMDKFGYTGSAAVGMALADAVNKHKLKKNDLVILLGSGGGLSMASLVMQWSYDT